MFVLVKGDATGAIAESVGVINGEVAVNWVHRAALGMLVAVGDCRIRFRPSMRILYDIGGFKVRDEHIAHFVNALAVGLGEAC